MAKCANCTCGAGVGVDAGAGVVAGTSVGVATDAPVSVGAGAGAGAGAISEPCSSRDKENASNPSVGEGGRSRYWHPVLPWTIIIFYTSPCLYIQIFSLQPELSLIRIMSNF